MKYQTLRDLYNIYFFGGIGLRMLKDCKTILELGCGRDSLLLKAHIVENTEVTGVDIFQPYVDSHNADKIYKECVCGDVAELRYGRDTFDAVVCMDLLEHIEKDTVLESGLLWRMKEWGKKVIITTPNGFIENPASDDNKFQKHVSGWSYDELSEFGYKVRGLSGWKALRTIGGDLRFTKPYLLWAVLSLFSQVVTYYLPKHSFHLLATYEK